MAIPKVIVLSEIMRGKTYELVSDRYTIGRTEDNDICVPDGTISTLHAEIIKDGDGFLARDNNSTNGTRINGIKITEQRLCNSDILQVGGIEILYDSEDKANTTAISTQAGMDILSSTGKYQSEALPNIDPATKNDENSVTDKSKIIFMVIIAVLVIVVGILLYLLIQRLVPST
jgi:pSer/pThr/pTyr-binding forkhead associated (FHA) protein